MDRPACQHSGRMRYQVIHRTSYVYDGAVTISHHLARLQPRNLPGQSCPWHELEIRPVPVGRWLREDSYGNLTEYFEIEGGHNELQVTARSWVEVEPAVHPEAADTPPWEQVRKECEAMQLTRGSEAGAYRFASPVVTTGEIFAAYARPDFPPGRPILEALIALTARVHREFRFDTRATDVATPAAQVLAERAGVCQDFAHLMLACLRSLGLPARYVSGYLETVPPFGMQRLTGADASHAWISLYCGSRAGWIDADPTNNVLPGERHITVAWGRDYSDVSPLRGVTLGAGGQTLHVAVDVIPATSG